MPPSPTQHVLGFRIIGALKLATAVLLAAAGFGIFHLVNKDLGSVVEHYVLRLHLDPENRLVHELITRVGGVDRTHLKALGVGTYFYAVLELTEGVGLLLQKHWAEYLTVIATGLLLPLEFYEIARKVSALRVAVMLGNLAILVYLIYRLWQERRATPERAAGPAVAPSRP